MKHRNTNTDRALRRRMTDTERVLWKHLRAHRLSRAKFKRQQPIGPYVVDFVCFEARLVIEVDGGRHQDCDGDRTRDAWLERQGLRVLRFWDNEVLAETAAVLERIAEFLPPSPPAPLPQGERGVDPQPESHKSLI